MKNLFNYNHDGADHQARAVLAFLQGCGEIEESWSDEWKEYKANPTVARWENCREQGYVICLTAEDGAQINIAFFEHRNSDDICAVKWEQKTINSPTIDTAKFGDVYKTKHDLSCSVNYAMIKEMAYWLKDELTSFWINHKKDKT